MDVFSAAFGDELCKLAARRLTEAEKEQRKLERDLRRIQRKAGRHPLGGLRGESSPRQRDYLASAALSAAGFPAVSLMQAGVSRRLRNKAIRDAMKGLSRRKRKNLQRKIETGPLVAKSHLKRKPGQLSKEDLLTRAAGGATAGSLLMALRDRFAGSTPVN